MASRSEMDLSCPVCRDIYKDPVTLSCKHSFCKDCLLKFWAAEQTSECPVCKRRSSMELPPFSLALRSRCEAFLQAEAAAAESKQLCSLHAEKLDVFCVDDQQLVCSVCRDSGAHGDHRFQPVDEAALDSKRTLQASLTPLRAKLRLMHQAKGDCDQTAEHIKVQAESTVRRIKEAFQKLHQFLEEEEEARMVALRVEEEEKSWRMKEKIGALSREIAALSDTIRATEEKLRAEDASFLRDYEATAERVRQQPLPRDPELVPGALIDVAKHLGNLTYNIWNKMKEMVSYSPVILDPNTAHPDLILSEDLTSAAQGQRKQQLPDNPERIDHFISAVGSEGFNSGAHSWEVEVGDNAAFVLGVLTESIQRKGIIWSGLWRLMFCGGEYKALSPSDTGSDVSVMKNPRRIRVHLDWDSGQLSFSDPDTNTHMHTFTHTFTDRLFPYVSTWSEVPLKIVAMKVSAGVEQHSYRNESNGEVDVSNKL
ncbi:nuclear factor 7, ovary-like [Chelmon rostratus]|uniref:nuclear factor 7, ovary-like n=1 Tax=Chelmon rostratus TaxID=109905 RepID=UPI001BE52F69|nr:nuclear factor 7, ovary-like [Chelmon rostratus]